MKTSNVCGILAACGLAAAAATARPGPFLINLSGATLLKNFLKAPASTNDFVDVNNNAVLTEQLAPAGLSFPFPVSQHWQVNYRAVGSVNGFQDLVDWGRTYANGANGVEMAASEAADDAYVNRTAYVVVSVPQGIANLSNPGGVPFRSLKDGSYAVTTATDVTAGVLIDAAPIDVPSIWAVQYPGGSLSWDRGPTVPGYGRNPRLAVNKDGTATTFDNLLVDAQAGNINFNVGAPDVNTIFDTAMPFAPIAIMTNLGTGVQQMTYSEIRHLNTTGRTAGGENLVWVTRDAGSGTRNAVANTTGVDPSWAVGENIGSLSNTSSQDLVGPNFRPSNKGATGRMIGTVINHRLSMGYAGAETGVNNAWLTGFQAECVAVKNDLAGGTVYARPTIGNVLDNTINGYNIGGPAVFATIGDPRAEPSGFPGFGDNNGHPRMRNVNAAAYLNNITRSVEAFKALPGGDPTVFSPGEFLASTLILPNARDNNTDRLIPYTVGPNPAFSSTLQEFVRGSNVLSNSLYASFNSTKNGLAPVRTTLTLPATYTDGNTVNYRTQGGTVVTAGASLNPGGALAAVGARNKICGDFNNDGVRNVSDIPNMIAAWRDRNGGPAWVDASAVVEILGDFNGDGNFNSADVRYFADGLAMATTVDSGTALNRKAGFVQVDASFNGNFFGTTLATPKVYAFGDSRGDVANSGGLEARGWAPIGFDGAVDAIDIDYVYAQFKQAGIAGGSADWSDLNEATRFDLSADMNGDLSVNQCDVSEVVTKVLGTRYGDYNLDGVVNGADRDFVAFAIAHPVSNPGWAGGDFNGDGVVNSADMAFVNIARCPGDVNGDGVRDFSDLNLILTNYNASGQCLPGSGDTDGDGDVDFSDLNSLLTGYNAPCPS